MKNRLVAALKAVGLTIARDDSGLEHIAGIPESIHLLARRIKNDDYHMLFVLLMKYPQISAEWIIRGTGEMILAENRESKLINELDRLRTELDHERQKVRYLEALKVTTIAPKKVGRPRKY